jgi:hypothetical protein
MQFECVVYITEEPLDRKKILDKFTEFLAGREPASVNPREDNCSECQWPVEVLFDGKGKMYVDVGSEKFAAPTTWRSDACCTASTKAMVTCSFGCSMTPVKTSPITTINYMF